MKKLMNLAIAGDIYTQDFHSDFTCLNEFLKRNSLDGLEVILSGDYRLAQMNKDIIIGHHLMYWPNWLDLWYGNKDKLLKEFMSEENIRNYYGFEDKDGMIAYLKNEFRLAKELHVEYMVFHVSHAYFEEIFTFDHHYKDQDILSAAIELINQVFTDDGPMLLFENMWLPGLTYNNKDLMKWFFDQIKYKQKGFLLDIAHLMSTNSKISNVDEGIDFVLDTLNNLGDMVDLIKAIHLSKAISGPYLSKDHSALHHLFMEKQTLIDGFNIIGPHIRQIDKHIPFDHIRINEIIQRIKPDYLVYEFIVKNSEELEEMIMLQHEYIVE